MQLQMRGILEVSNLLVEDPIDINISRAYCFWYQETTCSLVVSLNNYEYTVTRVI